MILVKIEKFSDFFHMKIMQDVREFVKEQHIDEEKASAVGMSEKAREFVAKGSEIYHGDSAENVAGEKQ